MPEEMDFALWETSGENDSGDIAHAGALSPALLAELCEWPGAES